ncbi:MAG: ATP synthase F0 subunit B, partial [Acidobacteriota bacterium]|nr:ATP synthase F0 subunit B [Acidobacteriota bacterium]
FLQTRARGIAEGLASGKRAQEEAEAKMSAIESQLARLDEEIDGLKQQADRESEEERQRIIDSSRAEAERIVAMARREIEVLQRSAQAELKAHVARLAVDLAEERLREDLEPSQNRRLISRFVRSLKETRS